jgi:hypothetical protein
MEVALEARQALMERLQALRLYYGFLEDEPLVEAAQVFYLQQIPRLQNQNKIGVRKIGFMRAPSIPCTTRTTPGL